MSTRCKIAGRLFREQRAERSAVVRGSHETAAAMTHALGFTHPAAIQARTVADFLDSVKRSPWRSSDRKQELFKQIAREISGAQPA